MRIALRFLSAGAVASLVMPGLVNAGLIVAIPNNCDGPCQEVIINPPVVPTDAPAHQPSASASSSEEAKKIIDGSKTFVPEFPDPPRPTGGLIEFVTPIKYSKSKSCSR